MLHLAWLEVKSSIRRPIWIVLAILSVLLFYSASVPDFEPSATRSLTGIPHFPLVSLGEWGRLPLLFGGSVVGAIFALFVSLMIVEAFHAELSHRDVLWATPGRGGLATTAPRVLAITTLATVIIYAGSAAALVNPENRQILVAAGGGYVPIYFALMWLQVLVWSSLSLFVFYLTRSRWITPIVVTVLSGLWFIAGLIGYPSSLVGLLHRSYLAWNFISSFAPWGLAPEMLALQAASYAGLGFLLVCGSIMIRRRFPEWRHVRQPVVRAALVLGILCAAGTVIGGAGVLRSHMAPFRLGDPRFDATGRLIQQSYADRPYIWSGNGVLLLYPGSYGAVRFLTGEEAPAWLDEVADGREIRLYEEAGSMIYMREGAIYSRRQQSIVLLLTRDAPFPAEVERSVARIREQLMPMLNRATIWHGGTKLYVAPPGMGIDSAEAVTDGLVISSREVLGSITRDSVAWALTEPTGLHEPERLYLYLYLTAVWDEERTEQYLDQLRSAACGDYELQPSSRRYWTPPVPRWDISWGTGIATRIVDHWEQGERLGHPEYIRSLVKEVAGDSA